MWFRVSLGMKEIFHMAGRPRFFSAFPGRISKKLNMILVLEI